MGPKKIIVQIDFESQKHFDPKINFGSTGWSKQNFGPKSKQIVSKKCRKAD